MNTEPRFLLESLSRWDVGWRLSQTEGTIMLPVPQDFHTTAEAVHHVKRLSAPLGCTLVVKITPDRSDGRERIIEIRHPATPGTAKSEVR